MRWEIRSTGENEFTALAGGEEIGQASMMLSGRHPDIALLDVVVDRRWRRRGLGSALVDHAGANIDRRLVVNREPDPMVEGFLAATRFEVAVNSEVRTVELDELASPARPDGVDVRSHEGITPALAEFYDEVYRRAHRWAGRYTPPADRPWIDVLGPATAGTVVTAERAGELIAVVSIHPEAEDFGANADGFLAPTSVVFDAPVDERAVLLGHLVGVSWAAARRAGLNSCATEFDTPYDDLAIVARSVPGTVTSRRQLWIR